MCRFFLIFMAASVIAAENPYNSISERNAFNLTGEIKILPSAPIVNAPEFDVFLSGIATLHKTERAYFVLKNKGTLKYITLEAGKEQDGIKLLEIFEDSVVIMHNGTKQHLTFKDNSLPPVALKAPSVKRSSSKGGEKRSRSSSKALNTRTPAPPSPGPQIVTVPSRRPSIDPSIIEKSLEYISKIDDPEKRNSLLERIEKYQKGEHSSGDSDERRKRYDEWRKKEIIDSSHKPTYILHGNSLRYNFSLRSKSIIHGWQL